MVGTVRPDQSLRNECQVLQHANGYAVFLGLRWGDQAWAEKGMSGDGG